MLNSRDRKRMQIEVNSIHIGNLSGPAFFQKDLRMTKMISIAMVRSKFGCVGDVGGGNGGMGGEE